MLKEFPKVDDDKEFRKIVVKFWQRCHKTILVIGTLREILRDFKKCKTAYQTLAELGIYMNKPGFDKERTQ